MDNYDLIVILEKKLNRGNILTQGEINMLATNNRIGFDLEVLSRLTDPEKETIYIENIQNIRSIQSTRIYNDVILIKGKKI